MPTYITRPVVNTSYSLRPAVQNDEWYWLDDDLSIMTDENNNRILFHNGDYYDSPTQYTTRTIPA